LDEAKLRKVKKMETETMNTKNDFSSVFSSKISAGEAIKKINNVPEWWGVTYTGSSEKQNDTFSIKMTEDSFFNFSVTELIPGKRVVWLVTDCNMPWYSDKKEWANTRLIFDLHENEGSTELKFTHEGLKPDIECYKDCAPGWTHWIQESLLSYFNTGKGVFRPPTK
jgi:Activator of Hsp90 ATPase homolog 1-like protein